MYLILQVEFLLIHVESCEEQERSAPLEVGRTFWDMLGRSEQVPVVSPSGPYEQAFAR